jgi:hypothetical protein
MKSVWSKTRVYSINMLTENEQTFLDTLVDKKKYSFLYSNCLFFLKLYLGNSNLGIVFLCIFKLDYSILGFHSAPL